MAPTGDDTSQSSTRIETADYFSERARRADLDAFDRFMKRAGGASPRPDDASNTADDAGKASATEDR